MERRAGRWRFIAMAWLAAAVLLGCMPPVGEPEPPGPDAIYVIDRGWHTEIGLPVDEIRGPLASLEARFPGVRYFTFGFGERQFFMARQPGPIETLSALLPSESALLVTALVASPGAAFGARHVVVLHVTAGRVARIEAAIWGDLEMPPGGGARVLAAGPYPGSAFYAARGTYDAFNTCNTWVAGVLHAGGLPVSAAGVLFSGQVMGMARAIAARQALLLRGRGAGRHDDGGVVRGRRRVAAAEREAAGQHQRQQQNEQGQTHRDASL